MLDNENKQNIEHSISRCQKQYALPRNMSFQEIIKKNQLILERTPVANDTKTKLLVNIADNMLPYLGILFKDCTLLLFDRNGFILKRYGTNLMKRRIIVFTEDILGTNGTGLVIKNGQPIKMSKNDYYLDALKIFETISVPIYDNNHKLLGGITISSLNELPDYYMEVIQFISNCLSGFINQPMHFGFSDLITLLSHFKSTRYAVTDDAGHLLAVNDLLISELGINDYKKFLNIPLNKLISIDNIHQLKELSSNNSYNDYFNKIEPQESLPDMPVYSLSQWSNLDVYEKSYKLLDLNPNVKNLEQDINVSPTSFSDTIIGESSIWKSVIHQVLKAAHTDFTVLLEGETGTGKELLASYIHKNSGRSGAFVAINCSALPKELALSELFGYESGSFTGAKKHGSIGKFELADGGTIFLDEIGDMPLDIQTYLLRFLETHTITKIGATRSKYVNVRIVAATNRLTFEEVEKGNFRKDLFYRLNSIKIQVPPLRQRGNDILLIANYILQKTCAKLNHSPMKFDKQSNIALLRYEWPGNIRELKNKIESAVVFAEKNIINCTNLGLPAPEQVNPTQTPLQASEKETVLNALKAFDFNISRTADYLETSRSTLYRKMKRYGIN
jgi:transcriptional regulator with PAS, ATPase and Fis domain